MRINCGASAAHRPQPVQATSHSASARSPFNRLRHAIHSRWLTGCSENKFFGHTSTQSPQAVHNASLTTGRP